MKKLFLLLNIFVIGSSIRSMEKKEEDLSKTENIENLLQISPTRNIILTIDSRGNTILWEMDNNGNLIRRHVIPVEKPEGPVRGEESEED